MLHRISTPALVLFYNFLYVTLPIMKINIIDRLINWSLICLFSLVPLFFTSVNYELFEFNKILLVYLVASFTFCLWMIKKILTGNWKINQTPIDTLFLLFLAGQSISFIFSIDHHTSFWGYYSRFNGGLLSLLAYFVIFRVIVDQKSTRLVNQIIAASLIAGLLVSLYAILEHFGHSFSCLIFTNKFDVACWVQDVQNRVFATLGQPNWLAAYLIVLIPISWSLFLIPNTKYPIPKKIAYCLLFIIFYSCLLFTKSRSGFLGFFVSFFIFWPLAFFRFKKSTLKPFLLFSLFIFIFTFKIGSPFSQLDKYFSWNGLKSHLPPPTSQGSLSSQPTNTQYPIPNNYAQPQLEVGGTESGKIRTIVWKGALAIFRRYPLFGSGPETFAYSYYQDRPMEHNLVSEWDFLYNKAHNEYLNYLATTGAIGLGAYLIFCIGFLFYAGKRCNSKSLITQENSFSDSKHFLVSALIAGFVGILVSNFFGFSVVISNLYLFALPAITIVLLQLDTPAALSSTSSTRRPLVMPAGSHPGGTNYIILTIIIFCFILSVRFLINLWRADYYYNKGDKLSKQQLFLPAYENINKAVELNQSEPLFQIDLAYAAANLAVLAQTNQDATTAGQLTEISEIFTQRAYQISPYNINLLKTKIKILYALSLINPKYNELTIQTILETIQKAPTDPKLIYNLGLMYGKNGNVELAIETIEQSLQMKPNFADARNALAQYFETLGLYPEAIEQLEYLNKYINPNDFTIVERINQLKQKTPTD